MPKSSSKIEELPRSRHFEASVVKVFVPLVPKHCIHGDTRSHSHHAINVLWIHVHMRAHNTQNVLLPGQLKTRVNQSVLNHPSELTSACPKHENAERLRGAVEMVTANRSLALTARRQSLCITLSTTNTHSLTTAFSPFLFRLKAYPERPTQYLILLKQISSLRVLDLSSI